MVWRTGVSQLTFLLRLKKPSTRNYGIESQAYAVDASCRDYIYSLFGSYLRGWAIKLDAFRRNDDDFGYGYTRRLMKRKEYCAGDIGRIQRLANAG